MVPTDVGSTGVVEEGTREAETGGIGAGEARIGGSVFVVVAAVEMGARDVGTRGAGACETGAGGSVMVV